MPFVYTGAPLSRKAIQSNEYRQREITGLTTGDLSKLLFLGIPTSNQIAYDGYLANLPAFLHSTATQARVNCSAKYFRSNVDHQALLPLPLPSLGFFADAPIRNETEKGQFMNKIGNNVRVHRFGNRDLFIIDRPTPAIVMDLPLDELDYDSPTPDNCTNLTGIFSYLTTLKIITLFLSTHTYPAFQTPDGSDQYARDLEVLVPKVGDAVDDKLRIGALREEYKQRRVRVQELDATVDDLEGYDEEEDRLYRGDDLVLVAKPAPFRPSINFGPPSTTPNYPGFVFPYFRGVCNPSKELIIHVMRRFFFGCFGSSAEDLRDGWQTWNRGVRGWHSTDQGRIIAHLLFVIQTTLECQGRCFVYLTGGRYLGCAILGYKTSIITETAVLIPDSPSDVLKLARSLDDHSDAVGRICELISSMKLKGTDDVEAVSIVNIPNARSLHSEIMRRDFPEAANVTEITELAKRLTFAETYWPMTVHYVVRALEVIVGKQEMGPDDPMYLSHLNILDASTAFKVWSAFGPHAPSFVDAAGTDFQIPRGLNAPDPLSIRDPSTRTPALSSIIISGKALNTAISDWKNVEKTRRIRLNLAERARGFRTITFTNTARDQIWNILKQIPWKEDEVTGSKRRREDDDDDTMEGPSRKNAEVKKSKKIKVF